MRFSLAAAIVAVLAFPAAALAHDGHGHGHGGKAVKRIVVIYEENHSFDNLYGGWEGVNGLRNADAAHTTQVDQAGAPYACLKQNDVNLTTPPLGAACAADSNFANEPFRIDNFIAPTDTTCPAPGVFAANGVPKGQGLPGGCTRDLVHRFYQEQYQLNGGKQNRYVTGSDAIGLTMGTYDTTALPIYKYLHAPGHPRYAIADDFFQAAFGGSFLNHQWLIAAASPTFPGATADQHSLLDSNGMPISYPLYTATGPVRDTAVTQACPAANGLACGDFAVNTIQPPYQPFSSPTALKLPPQTGATIGDRLSAKGVDWAWYSGGWSNADGDVNAPGWTNGSGPTCSDPNAVAGATFPNCPDKLFQFHHQPFNYFASFAPGTAMRRDHLRDEAEFESLATGSKKRCELKPVSLIKPVGAENEHPGYASEHSGSSHLVDLLTSIQNSRCAKDTMVIVTYDEFGGQWDHVSPPGQGGTPGAHDQWGPSTRIPALVLSPKLKGDFVVDNTQYDTTSIMATIEQRFGLKPVSSRDAAVNSMFDVFSARAPKRNH
ncbi:MAG TPA: acid phosphatase [Solirubrobacteraceae bacterium]|nr:acid phosphatase [Solirubrobacteraceae bacterium]